METLQTGLIIPVKSKINLLYRAAARLEVLSGSVAQRRFKVLHHVLFGMVFSLKQSKLRSHRLAKDILLLKIRTELSQR